MPVARQAIAPPLSAVAGAAASINSVPWRQQERGERALRSGYRPRAGCDETQTFRSQTLTMHLPLPHRRTVGPTSLSDLFGNLIKGALEGREPERSLSAALDRDSVAKINQTIEDHGIPDLQVVHFPENSATGLADELLFCLQPRSDLGSDPMVPSPSQNASAGSLCLEPKTLVAPTTARSRWDLKLIFPSLRADDSDGADGRKSP